MTIVSIRTRLWHLLKAEIKSNLIFIIKMANSSSSSKYQKQARAKRNYSYSNNNQTATPNKIKKYYSALELEQGAKQSEVKAAYIKLVKKYHPDKFQDEEKKQLATELLQKINEAYAEVNEHLLQTAS